MDRPPHRAHQAARLQCRCELLARRSRLQQALDPPLLAARLRYPRARLLHCRS
jgi:hypothetical protein